MVKRRKIHDFFAACSGILIQAYLKGRNADFIIGNYNKNQIIPDTTVPSQDQLKPMEHVSDTSLLDQNHESKPEYQIPEEPESSKSVKAEAEPSIHRSKRRGRKPSQTAEEKRKKKIECDKNRRKRVKTDYERLKDIEPEYNRLKNMEHTFELRMKELRATNEKLVEENKTLNSRVLELSAEIEKLRKEVHQRQDLANIDSDQMDTDIDWANYLNTDDLLEGVEEWEDKFYDNLLVESFIEQLNSKTKSEIDYSDFQGLDEELQTGGYNKFPSSLAEIAEQIREKYGVIDSESSQSKRSALTPHILFHAAMREMTSLTLAQVTREKLIKWNNAIKDAFNIDFKVKFARNHLDKIAYAYFGLAAEADKDDQVVKKMNARILKLETVLCDLKKKHDEKADVRRQCIEAAEYFADQPLSKGLFSS